MVNQDERTIRVVGQEAFDKIQNLKILVFGVGGVGGYVVEGLVRAGVKNFKLVDNDTVNLTNLNRQIIALYSTLDKLKVDVIKQRILDIRDDANVEVFPLFYLPDQNLEYLFDDVDYIVDAIDTISAKIDIILLAQKKNIPIISCMGTGNKLHPEMLEFKDIYKTEMCPVCKVMRHELKKRDVKKLKVLFSKEEPVHTKTRTPGSVSFVPSVAGLMIASEIINDIKKC